MKAHSSISLWLSMSITWHLVLEGMHGTSLAREQLTCMHLMDERRFCSPGRYFALAELKAMLAWLVLHYDVKMEKEGIFPKPTYFQAHSPPNHTAKVLFRRRQGKL